MSEPKCPRWGEPCIRHECEFFDKVPATGDYVCRDELRNLYLDDIAQYMAQLLGSSEQHRETVVQGIRSRMKGGATPELLQLTGMKQAEGE